MGDGAGQRNLTCCSPWGSQRVGYNLGTQQQQQNLKDKNCKINYNYNEQLRDRHEDVK